MPFRSPAALAIAWPSVMPISSTMWCASMCRSPLASMARSINPCRATCSSMCSRNGSPVSIRATPRPSRFTETVIWVSLVLRDTSACPQPLEALARIAFLDSERDEIRLAGPGAHARQPGERPKQLLPVLPYLLGLFIEQGQTGQREFRAGLGETPDVVREPDFIELLKPDRRTGKHAEAQTGETMLGKRTHHQQIVMFPQFAHEGFTGKGIVSLVHHYQARCLLYKTHDILAREQVSGRVVGIGNKNNRRFLRCHCFSHGRHIERKILSQRYAHKLHVEKGRDHLVQ